MRRKDGAENAAGANHRTHNKTARAKNPGLRLCTCEQRLRRPAEFLFSTGGIFHQTDTSTRRLGIRIDIYADEGITGTRADKRDEFQRLMRDCRAGRIDRILVKSISRFGRNSTDCIQAVRELKLLGVAVAFEKEGIDTGQMTSEMYFSMYSAFSQEESTSIAKNMRRGAAMRMKNGTYRLSQAPYGYRLDENGGFLICA